MPIHFACEGNLPSALGGRLLGAYDGAGSWRVFLQELSGDQEQSFVEMHEGMHHELQTSTGWGLVCALAAGLVERDYRTDALRPAFECMVESSRGVHEMFATAISSFVVGMDLARELLIDNLTYSDYLRQAYALVPRDQAPSTQFHQAAVIAVLRAAMSPASALALLDIGYDKLGPQSVQELHNTPDRRIAAYRASPMVAAWGPMLANLAAEHPEQVSGPWSDDPSAAAPDETSAEFNDRRRFEDEVLLPACYSHVEKALQEAGYPTIRFGSQAELALRVKATVGDVDPELASRLRLITDRRPVADDGLQYDRQQLVLRDRLTAAVRTYTASAADREFLAWQSSFGSTMLGVWVSAAVARKQWSFDPHDIDVLPDPLRALVQAGFDSATGEPLVALALLDAVTPRQVQTAIGAATPLVVLTTHSSLANEELGGELGQVEPVFVLMDLPIAHHVDEWIAQGRRVTMAASHLVGTPGELWVLAFAIDQAPAFTFLSLNGQTATSMLIERLRRSHGDDLSISAEILARHEVGANLAITKILALWHVLDQDGTELHNPLAPGNRDSLGPID